VQGTGRAFSSPDVQGSDCTGCRLLYHSFVKTVALLEHDLSVTAQLLTHTLMCSSQERRWRALGAHIQRLGGVLSAEEMAPFLDPPPLGRTRRRGSEKYEDESFVLPALIRFNGEPFVDDGGRLLYKFPDLQVNRSRCIVARKAVDWQCQAWVVAAALAVACLLVWLTRHAGWLQLVAVGICLFAGSDSCSCCCC
jgi:hypothetical protein